MAADYQLGTLQTGVVTKSGGNVGTFYNPSDNIFFSLSSKNDLSANVARGAKLTITPLPGYNLDFFLKSLTADLYTSGGALVSHLASIGNSPGTATVQTTNLTDLTGGDYYITVAGQALSPLLGGSYGLSLTATQAAAAPGPAGFLFVGGAAALMARRRRQKAKAGLA